jgi:hypothetical protein
MSNYWITEQGEFRKNKLAQLEIQAASALEDASIDRIIAIGAGCASTLAGALALTSEFAAHKWGTRQDLESAIGAFALGITIIEISVSKMNRRRAADTWQRAAQYFMADEISE